MALIDRFALNAHSGPGGNGLVRIPAHQFAGAICLLVENDIDKQDIINFFVLTITEQIQLDQMIAHYLALPTNLEKLMYVVKIQSVLPLVEDGSITTAQAAGFLGLT
jgi:hypothetical protein